MSMFLNISGQNFIPVSTHPSNRNLPLPILLCHLEFITPLVYSQSKVDSVYFEFSNTFHFVPHASLLRNLMIMDHLLLTLTGFIVTGPTEHYHALIVEQFLLLMLFYLLYNKDQSWDLSFSTF
jgi:hypothetical protein